MRGDSKPVRPVARAVAAVAASMAVLLASACSRPAPEMRTGAAPTSAAHAQALARIGDPSLGEAWVAAREGAVARAVNVLPPFSATLRLGPDTPEAGAFVVPAYQGQRLEARVDGEAPVYIDLYVEASSRPNVRGRLQLVARSVTTGGSGASLDYSVRSTGTYVLVVQPPSFAGGEIDLFLDIGPSLVWPLPAAGEEEIWSYFGLPREGGLRVHHGLDIFAPQGSELVAVGAGEVVSVGVRELGGNVVSMVDEEQGIFVYYAHLTEQRVEEGARVSPGDVVGTVGNTGNAITTPPHLHIGIYDGSWGRPVDPWYFFVESDGPAPPARPVGEITHWGRAVGTGVVYRRPSSQNGTKRSPARVDARGRPLHPSSFHPNTLPATPIIGRLAEGELVRLAGSVGEYYKVRLTDGRWGYTTAALETLVEVEPPPGAVEEVFPLYASPMSDSPVVGSISGTELAEATAFAAGPAGPAYLPTQDAWVYFVAR